MTVLRPAPASTDSGQRDVGVVRDARRLEVDRLLATDPIVNAVLIARLASSRTLEPTALGGTFLGARDQSGELTALAFHGGNLLAAGGGRSDWSALAAHLAPTARVCTSVVGRAETVAAMWPALEQSWGTPRAVRPDQPLLVLTRGEVDLDEHQQLRAMTRADLERYLPAAAAMFTEELGVSPFAGRSGSTYRRRIEGLIAGGRALGIVDDDGRMAFKADLAVITRDTCQVQGVWVRPDLRGHGLGTAALGGVLAHALRLAPTVSLYVNDFNTAARRAYRRVGMRQAATLATVLL